MRGVEWGGEVTLRWRCTLCDHRVETEGVSHSDPADLTTLGYEALGHVETCHGEVESYLEVVAMFAPVHCVAVA